jgi:pyruvate formate lyase activating enzyme
MVALIFQKGWNFSQDGPGNRLLYHFQGCNFKCPWCSNPEGISPSGTLIFDKKNLLESACSNSVNAINNNDLNRTVCAACQDRACLTANRTLGIRLSAKSYPVSELVAEAFKAKLLFHNGGGVTLTGGEPTLQFESAKALLSGLKSAGINTAIETNGTNARLPELFPLIDTLIIDCKHIDDVMHTRILGLGNKTILANIESAARLHPHVWLRIPLIPGFNDQPADWEAFAGFLRTLKQDNCAVEILPYHEYCKVKWEQCGMPYTMQKKELPAGAFDAFTEILIRNKIHTIQT